MKFLIKYTAKIKETLKVSPYTGKEYKKPRIHRHWIGLSEYIKAGNLETAFKVAMLLMHEHQAFLAENFPKTELELDSVEAEETPEVVIK